MAALGLVSVGGISPAEGEVSTFYSVSQLAVCTSQLSKLFEVAKSAPSTTPWWEEAMVALSTMVGMGTEV